MGDIALECAKNCATVRQKILAGIKIQCNIMHISLEIALNKNHYFQLSFLITICLLRTNTENWTNIPRKGTARPISTFMCLWAIYIFPGSICLFCCKKYVDRSREYINRSQTHQCGNLDWGRAIPIKGIHKCDFRCSVLVCLALMYFRDLITANSFWRGPGVLQKSTGLQKINFPLLGKCKPQCK
jgi:hypothetical protein